jgi:hypothetical protein
MNVAWKRRWIWWIGIVLALPVGGCAVLSDILAPSLPLQLGIDAATITPQEGVVLVAFNNTTPSQATFFAFEAINAQNLSAGSRNFSRLVDGGTQQNEVLDCPVGVVAPGSLSATFEPQTLAATVASTSGTTTNLTSVQYTGPVLEAGSAFSCGDMIEITLSPTGGQAGFAITVRVVPGR